MCSTWLRAYLECFDTHLINLSWTNTLAYFASSAVSNKKSRVTLTPNVILKWRSNISWGATCHWALTIKLFAAVINTQVL
jgi:hypothetical protein